MTPTTRKSMKFGLHSPSNQEMKHFELRNNLISISVSPYGATLVSFFAEGKDLLLGYESIEGFQSETNPFFGATVGRCANRIANGSFTLKGKTIETPKNNGPNTLHGGDVGFDKCLFEVGEMGDDFVEFTYLSVDGDMGFPGDCRVKVKYQVVGDECRVTMSATMSGSDCPVSLANHAYWNLGGHDAGKSSLLAHRIKINAQSYLPTDSTSIPTGIAAVENTPFDFRLPREIGERIDELKDLPGSGAGYDHNFCLDTTINGDADGDELRLAAEVTYGDLRLQVHTTAPGLQFYSGNYLGPSDLAVDGAASPGPDQPFIVGKGGRTYERQGGFALEAQEFPNAVNDPSFPNCIVIDGGTKVHQMVYKVTKV